LACYLKNTFVSSLASKLLLNHPKIKAQLTSKKSVSINVPSHARVPSRQVCGQMVARGAATFCDLNYFWLK